MESIRAAVLQKEMEIEVHPLRIKGNYFPFGFSSVNHLCHSRQLLDPLLSSPKKVLAPLMWPCFGAWMLMGI